MARRCSTLRDSPAVLDPLDKKSAPLFLIAGGLLVVFAANTGARVFADAGISAVHSFVGPAGFALGLLGLLGLHPALADRTPWAANVAGAVAVIPTVGWSVITVFGIGSAAGILPGMSVVFPAVFPILVFLTTILAYILFGVASFRAGVNPRRISTVLLVPVVPFLALIAGAAVLGPVEWAEFAIDTGHALAHLIVGTALLTEGVPTAGADPAAEATP